MKPSTLTLSAIAIVGLSFSAFAEVPKVGTKSELPTEMKMLNCDSYKAAEKLIGAFEDKTNIEDALKNSDGACKFDVVPAGMIKAVHQFGHLEGGSKAETAILDVSIVTLNAKSDKDDKGKDYFLVWGEGVDDGTSDGDDK